MWLRFMNRNRPFNVGGSFPPCCTGGERMHFVVSVNDSLFWSAPHPHPPSPGTLQRRFQPSCHVQGSAEEEQRWKQGRQKGLRYVDDQMENGAPVFRQQLAPHHKIYGCFASVETFLNVSRTDTDHFF